MIINYKMLEEAIKQTEETIKEYNDQEKKIILEEVYKRIKTRETEHLHQEMSIKGISRFMPKGILKALQKDKEEED